MIEARNLTKHYGDKLAVDDLSFTVERGKVTGFLGPNGAGKSTTMRLILGLDRPNSGDATIDGKHYRDRAARHTTTCCSWPRPRDWTASGSTRSSTWSGCTRSPASGPAVSRWAWGNGWASRRRCWATRRCWSWTNPSTDWTPKVWSGSGT